MRLYEYIASKYVSDVTLDKLTLDTTDCAKRTSQEIGNSGAGGSELVRSMFTSCFNANIISYLADYSVHQIILCYGYYLYVQQQRNNRKQQLEPNIAVVCDTTNNTGVAIEYGSIIVSMLKKSTLLAIHRGVCLTSASAGGAIGSYVFPGLGTIGGLNLGDAFACTVTTTSLVSDAP
jgi:hypothetical protein